MLEQGTDIAALAEGYISITPRRLDMTAYHLMENINQWGWKKPLSAEIFSNQFQETYL